MNKYKPSLLLVCLLTLLIQDALSCSCVEFHEVPHSLSEDTLCTNGSTYNGRPYYLTDNKRAYLFYNVSGTWLVGPSLGTTSYYLISYGNASLPQHTTSWDIKSPSSSSFSTDPDISVKCYEKHKKKSSKFNIGYLVAIFVPIGVICCAIRIRARQGKLCKKRKACSPAVGVAASNPTCVTTQQPCVGQQAPQMDQNAYQNGRVGQEGQETGKRRSISDLPGYSSVNRDNGGSKAQEGFRTMQMTEPTGTTGTPPYPRNMGLSYAPPYTYGNASLPGAEHVPPPPTYDAAVTSVQDK